MRFAWLLIALMLAVATAGVLKSHETAARTGHLKKPVKKAKKGKKNKVVKPSGPLANVLFAAAKLPAPMPPQAIGFYAKGCLAGGVALPTGGPAWQVMRLSRNRNWGHPDLIALVEKLALEAREHDGWPGLLVGDIAQPRGGPMLAGHASHQVGLDADIWLTPMPDRRLSEREREELPAASMVGPDRGSVDPNVWTDAHLRLIKRAASYPSVERIFVHPAIKKALCESTPKDADRDWLHKVRAYWGHDSHFHMRIACPTTSAGCVPQSPLPNDDGCGQELTNWLALVQKPAKPLLSGAPAIARRHSIALDQLPAACRVVLGSDGVDLPANADGSTSFTFVRHATKK